MHTLKVGQTGSTAGTRVKCQPLHLTLRGPCKWAFPDQGHDQEGVL